MPGIYKEGTLGIPLPKVNVKIVNPKDGQEQKYDEVGEVCFHAPNIMSGYFKNPKETDNIIKVHADGKKWIHTGDLGSVNQDGFLRFQGRIKKIYLTKGSDNSVYKLFPMQIENELEKIEDFLECGTIVVPDQEKIHEQLCTGSDGNSSLSYDGTSSCSDEEKRIWRYWTAFCGFLCGRYIS